MNSYWFPVNRYITPPTLSVTSASMGITTAGVTGSRSLPMLSGSTAGLLVGAVVAGLAVSSGLFPFPILF